MSVLDEVAAERARQFAKWGVQRHPDGTGPDSMPLYAETATGIADNDEAAYIRDVMQGRTEWRFHDTSTRDQPGTWVDVFLEEVFEAIAESDPEKLRTELIQVAAVAVQWVEAIDARQGVARALPVAPTTDDREVLATIRADVERVKRYHPGSAPKLSLKEIELLLRLVEPLGAAEFDRWLAAHDAQVRAEALREAAESYVYVHAVSRLHSKVYQWLRARSWRAAEGAS